MKRLLLLALPALLAGCPKPQAAGETPPTASAELAKPADTATTGKIEFGDPGAVRMAGTLPKYHWRLASAVDAQGRPIDALLVRPAQPLTLDFQDGRLAISNTCNRMSGSYTLGGNGVAIGRLASTMMACTDPKLMALDQEVGKRLQGKLGVRLSKGDARQLELKTASGDVLVFASEETAATRHGSAGERVFLEVAAQTAPCSHPMIPNMQCLQVREIKYDEKGLKVGTPGPFGNFYATIEGFTHEPGVRTVLRVDRYTIKNPPADAPSQAFVLDMVVESDASGKP
jgi:heat shock protein HslJ